MKMNCFVIFNSHHSIYLYVRTNQKHVGVVKEENVRRCDWGTERRGCYYIVLIAKEEGGKKKNKINLM